jgi:2-C-methyl-D-erythritol 2,4-cyclodiphosphate synthase
VVSGQRIGLGFDVHRFDEGRPLRLGGVLFEGEPGLAGHSDGDVVCHAIADGLFGAAALGDLGEHFPDTDPVLAGIAGPELLGRALGKARDAGYAAESVDLTVIAERPSIAPSRDAIRVGLAEVLGVANDRVSIKATRPEGLGLSGDGVGCIALVVLSSS